MKPLNKSFLTKVQGVMSFPEEKEVIPTSKSPFLLRDLFVA